MLFKKQLIIIIFIKELITVGMMKCYFIEMIMIIYILNFL